MEFWGLEEITWKSQGVGGGGSTVVCERVVPVNMCIVCCNLVPDHKTSHVYSQAQAHDMFTATNSV